MQELDFITTGKLKWRDVAAPQLEADVEALVRPIAVATCDLDAGIVRGEVPVAGPFPFGHEAVAEVVDIGAAVRTVALGDLVSVPFQISCGTCGQCRRGRTAHCTAVPRLSMYGLGSLSGAPWGGFLSDLVRVPFADSMLVPIPDGVAPLAVASLSDNIADAWRTVGPPLAKEPGAAVLIVSGGTSVPLYATAIAIALGASQVDFVGGRRRDLDLAVSLGAHVIEGPFPRRLGPYPITVAALHDRAGLACAIRSTAPDGVCTSCGIYFEGDTPLPLLEMYSKGIRFVTGRVHARTAMSEALDLVASGRLRPEPITARVARWEEAAEALADHDAKLVISRERA
nr:putative zinc-binding alcohol dehydrogenase [uncultured bacterium]